jgi:hypothetical protein
MATKKPKATAGKKDYFKLPFEIKYENLEVTSYELLYNGDNGAPKRFADFVALRQETGRSYGVTYRCDNNSGGELRACILEELDEVIPPWLSLEEEESVDFDWGCYLGTKIDGDMISFVRDDVEDEDELSESGESIYVYSLEGCDPEYLILDAEDSRIKVSMGGYLLVEDEEGFEEEGGQIFEVEKVEELEFEDVQTLDMYARRSRWIKSILEKFPKDKKLRLDPGTD